jgi:glycosyltransferase involved in cell wall biosynthesis
MLGALEGHRVLLSVVIATHDSERTLLPTLAALVSGAAAGIVREVIVADAGSRDATTAIADGAGCRVLVSAQGRGARLKAAAEAARAPWLLFLRPGVVLDATWVDETRRFVEEAELRGCAGTHAAVFRASAFRPALLEAWALLGAALGAKPDASEGLVIAKARYAALAGHRDVEEPERDLRRRLRRRHLVLLHTGAIVAGSGKLLD